MDVYAIHVLWATHPIELKRILHAVGRAFLLHVLHERGRHADIQLGGSPEGPPTYVHESGGKCFWYSVGTMIRFFPSPWMTE